MRPLIVPYCAGQYLTLMIHKLPLDPLYQIFDLLTDGDLLRIGFTCKALQAVFPRPFRFFNAIEKVHALKSKAHAYLAAHAILSDQEFNLACKITEEQWIESEEAANALLASADQVRRLLVARFLQPKWAFSADSFTDRDVTCCLRWGYSVAVPKTERWYAFRRFAQSQFMDDNVVVSEILPVPRPVTMKKYSLPRPPRPYNCMT